jgi:hypothetical protein
MLVPHQTTCKAMQNAELQRPIFEFDVSKSNSNNIALNLHFATFVANLNSNAFLLCEEKRKDKKRKEKNRKEKEKKGKEKKRKENRRRHLSRASPDDGGVRGGAGAEEEGDGHEAEAALESGRLDGQPAVRRARHAAAAHAQHLRQRGPAQIQVQQPHAPQWVGGERAGELRGQRALAHAALPGQHRNHAPDRAQAPRQSRALLLLFSRRGQRQRLLRARASSRTARAPRRSARLRRARRTRPPLLRLPVPPISNRTTTNKTPSHSEVFTFFVLQVGVSVFVSIVTLLESLFLGFFCPPKRRRFFFFFSFSPRLLCEAALFESVSGMRILIAKNLSGSRLFFFKKKN